SRLESGHIKPKNDWCDIVELVYEVVKRVEENNPKRKIDVSINQNMPLCSLDKGMLEQIIYNLLNNAAVHTEPDCKIDISVMCHADLLEIVIEDNGKGFTDVDIKQVFDKFSRSQNSITAGSGLGLSIVKGFTEALNGMVEFSHADSGGARFSISIPVKTTYLIIAEE
ncbi:MAG TPA: ATP-binding protein, partial [Chitinophagaceae bacterium]|nr:ATP-binding protein [Chitinophagaceae bacterium]